MEVSRLPSGVGSAEWRAVDCPSQQSTVLVNEATGLGWDRISRLTGVYQLTDGTRQSTDEGLISRLFMLFSFVSALIV